jgi:hypothetical protein
MPPDPYIRSANVLKNAAGDRLGGARFLYRGKRDSEY